jgi:hypothetical protein
MHDLVSYLEDFLASDAPPLFRWHRLAGFAQWACTTIPLARSALNSVHRNIAGKQRRNGPIRIINNVKSDLT